MRSSLQPRIWIVIIHLIFWVLVTGLLMLVLSFILKSFIYAFAATVVNLVGFLILIYGHLLWLLPYWFDRRKFLFYVLGLLGLLLTTSALRFYGGWSLVRYFQWDIAGFFTPSYLGSIFFTGTFFLLITIPLRLIENWFKKQELEQELKTHQLEAELRFLKAQVNPHFLFNALNNIYSLSFTASKKAPEMILKLSDMMSYMLYDCKQELVPLNAEINYLRNYIDLQQLKKDGELNVEFSVEGDISGMLVTPMLFIPFFENAFKHGNLENIQQGWLRSNLKAKDGVIVFRIANSLSEISSKYKKGGVGLENVRQRLRLLFTDRHELSVRQNAGEYVVHLIINLQGPWNTDA